MRHLTALLLVLLTAAAPLARRKTPDELGRAGRAALSAGRVQEAAVAFDEKKLTSEARAAAGVAAHFVPASGGAPAGAEKATRGGFCWTH